MFNNTLLMNTQDENKLNASHESNVNDIDGNSISLRDEEVPLEYRLKPKNSAMG